MEINCPGKEFYYIVGHLKCFYPTKVMCVSIIINNIYTLTFFWF